MVVNANLLSSGTNILSIFLANKELGRLEYPLEGKSNILAFDALERINHTRTQIPTRYPIENGAIISDHIINNPLSVTFDIIISDTPLLGLATATNVFGAVATAAAKVRKLNNQVRTIGSNKINNVLSKVSKTASSIVDGSFIRSQDTFDLINEIVEKKLLVSANIGFKYYENMCISNFYVPEEVGKENCLVGSITLEEVVIVESSTTNVPSNLFVDSSVAHTANSTVKQGAKDTAKAPQKNADSWAYQLFVGG